MSRIRKKNKLKLIKLFNNFRIRVNLFVEILNLCNIVRS